MRVAFFALSLLLFALCGLELAHADMQCDPLLLNTGKDPETAIKYHMIPGIKLLAKQKDFPDHKRAKDCAYFFGHGSSSGISGYDYGDLYPLVQKYDRVYIFACAQDKKAAIKQALPTLLKVAIKEKSGPNAAARYYRAEDDFTLSEDPKKKGELEKLKKTSGWNTLQEAKSLAETRAKELNTKIKFTANRVINLYPCAESICAWLTPLDEQAKELGFTDAKDIPWQLSYKPFQANTEEWKETIESLKQQKKNIDETLKNGDLKWFKNDLQIAQKAVLLTQTLDLANLA